LKYNTLSTTHGHQTKKVKIMKKKKRKEQLIFYPRQNKEINEIPTWGMKLQYNARYDKMKTDL